MEFVQVLAGAVLLSVINNGCIEYLFKQPLDKFKVDSWWLIYVSVALAELIVFGMRINLLAGVGVDTELARIIGTALTGVAMARGSNYLADLPWPVKVK